MYGRHARSIIGSMRMRSQDEQLKVWLARRRRILARLKGLANGVNPRWGVRTVIVSDGSGKIIRVENRRRPGVEP